MPKLLLTRLMLQTWDALLKHFPSGALDALDTSDAFGAFGAFGAFSLAGKRLKDVVVGARALALGRLFGLEQEQQRPLRRRPMRHRRSLQPRGIQVSRAQP